MSTSASPADAISPTSSPACYAEATRNLVEQCYLEKKAMYWALVRRNIAFGLEGEAEDVIHRAILEALEYGKTREVRDWSGLIADITVRLSRKWHRLRQTRHLARAADSIEFDDNLLTRIHNAKPSVLASMLEREHLKLAKLALRNISGLHGAALKNYVQNGFVSHSHAAKCRVTRAKVEARESAERAHTGRGRLAIALQLEKVMGPPRQPPSKVDASQSLTPEKVIEIRTSLRYSQRAFAERIGVAAATVSKWERGVYRCVGPHAQAVSDCEGEEPQTKTTVPPSPKRTRLLLPPDQIVEIRRSLGCSQRAFSKKIGVSTATISKWERGVARCLGSNAQRVIDSRTEAAIESDSQTHAFSAMLTNKSQDLGKPGKAVHVTAV